MSEQDFCIDFSDPYQRQDFINYVSTLRGKVLFKSRKFNSKISVSQHHYYRGVIIRIIAQETGHSLSEVHNILKNSYLRYSSTKGISTIEAEEYFSWIRAEMDLLDIRIPLPNQIIEDNE